MKVLYKILCICLLLSVTSCDKEPIKVFSTKFKNQTWIGKRDLNIYMDKKTHYVIIKFDDNGGIMIGNADSNKFIFSTEVDGFYKFEDDMIIPYETQECKNRSGERLRYNKYDKTIEGYGVRFYRQS